MKRPLRVLSCVLWCTVGCAADAEPVVECGPEVPTVTWETFGEGFVTTHCQGCHASVALDRQGAPEGIVFDTEIDALTQADRILEAAASELPRMPPAGGPNEDERHMVSIWLTCFADE